MNNLKYCYMWNSDQSMYKEAECGGFVSFLTIILVIKVIFMTIYLIITEFRSIQGDCSISSHLVVAHYINVLTSLQQCCPWHIWATNPPVWAKSRTREQGLHILQIMFQDYLCPVSSAGVATGVVLAFKPQECDSSWPILHSSFIDSFFLSRQWGQVPQSQATQRIAWH